MEGSMLCKGRIFWVVHHFVLPRVRLGLKAKVLIGLITKWNIESVTLWKIDFSKKFHLLKKRVLQKSIAFLKK